MPLSAGAVFCRNGSKTDATSGSMLRMMATCLARRRHSQAHKALLAILMLVDASAAADTVIHRCTQSDGTVSFQETPCAEPAEDDDGRDDDNDKDIAEPAPVDNVLDFVNPFDEAASPPVADRAEVPVPLSRDREECEETTRDAIDAIDAEMRNDAYNEEQGREYLAKLLELTRQLRACKQL